MKQILKIADAIILNAPAIILVGALIAFLTGRLG